MTSGEPNPKMQVRDLSVSFGGTRAFRHLNLDVLPNERLAIIGPASSGKTTFLRCLNPMTSSTDSPTRAKSSLMGKTFTARKLMSRICAAGSEWSMRCRSRYPGPSTTTWCMVQDWLESVRGAP